MARFHQADVTDTVGTHSRWWQGLVTWWANTQCSTTQRVPTTHAGSVAPARACSHTRLKIQKVIWAHTSSRGAETDMSAAGLLRQEW